MTLSGDRNALNTTSLFTLMCFLLLLLCECYLNLKRKKDKRVKKAQIHKDKGNGRNDESRQTGDVDKTWELENGWWWVTDSKAEIWTCREAAKKPRIHTQNSDCLRDPRYL